MDEFNMLEKGYKELQVQRRCGLRNVLARIENIKDIIEHECSEGLRDSTPFDTIKHRIKTFESAYDKIGRKGWDESIESFKKMHDIAGIRIITPYLSDVYDIREILYEQIEKTKPKNTMRIVHETDYIENPKENGYRSLHLDVEVKIAATKSSKAEWIPVEIQIRTKAMDLWASIEHKLKYKNPHPSHDTEAKLSDVADYLIGFDEMVMQLRDENDEEAIGLEDFSETQPLSNLP